MKKLLLLCFVGSFVFAQTDDTSKEEALLNDLLNSSPIEDSNQEMAPVESAPADNRTLPESETSPSVSQAVDASLHSATNSDQSRSTNTVHVVQQVEAATQNRYSDEQPIVPAQTSGAARQRGNGPDEVSSKFGELARVQETPDIPNFSHKAHIEDIGAECVQCHQTLFAESVRGIKQGPSTKEICSQCHNGTDARSEVLAGFSDEKKYVKTYLPLFSHTKHNQYTEECITCHTDIYKKLKKIKNPPPMDRCMGCHNDRKADSDCKVCHENPNKLKPKTHTSRWVYRNGHGKSARNNKKECTSCHAEHECNTCHRGQTTFDIHRPGYKYSHGMDARQRTVNCGYCHNATYSCAQCHERNR